MRTEVSVLGAAATSLRPDHELVLDELVFGCVVEALRSAAISHRDIDLSILASMDVYDGRSISAGLTIPAAAGYRSESLRLEADAAAAIVAALEAVEAEDADTVVVAAVFNPEVLEKRPFLDQISNFAFDPVAARPVAMTSTVVAAMHATAWLESGGSEAALITRAAAARIRGSVTDGVTALTLASAEREVVNAPMAAWPLRTSMLPAPCSCAVALVLASAERAARSSRPLARFLSWGMAANPSVESVDWVVDAGMATAEAARIAYIGAGMATRDGDIAVAEVTAATPALESVYLEALGLETLAPERVNPTGGALVHYPGIANGAVRVMDTAMTLHAIGVGARGVVHCADLITGPVNETATVFVMEGS